MAWRPFRHADWSVLGCGINGHVTYRPDESDLAARLTAATPAGPIVRCLRCGAWILGEPRGSGPADHAPLVRRGPALRDAVILRLLAIERIVKALILFTLAYGIWRFQGSQEQIRAMVDSWLPLLAPLATRLGYDIFDTSALHLIQQVLALRRGTLQAVWLGVLGYGLIQSVEGVGLWLMRRWGEYVAVVATSLFIPLEIYELVDRLTVLRVLALIINLAAVAYLVWTKRLFGVRGGRAAYEAERHGQSLVEIERIALARERSRRRIRRVRRR